MNLGDLIKTRPLIYACEDAPLLVDSVAVEQHLWAFGCPPLTRVELAVLTQLRAADRGSVPDNMPGLEVR